ncbi:MAG: hypothetical protein JSS68_14960 [Actinobacteria bacterium]|nr:hypothetical protein [Actinomycetota bacterium]
MAMVIHQAQITYSDGKTGRFFSTDGTWFYEHQLPEKNARTLPFRYERAWLKSVATGLEAISAIEFTETEA